MVRWRSTCVAFLVAILTAAAVSGQSTASIAGVVHDSAGGVVPGVTVIVKEDATGAAHEAVTDVDGRYQVTALGAGAYTVTASLTGFKTAVAKSIRVAPGQPVTIPLTLEVGSLTETVTVTSSSELINTQTATVASTLNSDQLTRMPTPTRNALNAVTFLPGVNTPGTNRDSTVNGPNFTPVNEPTAASGGYTSASFSRVTAAYTDASNTYDPGGRIGQLMFRFSW